MLKTLSVAAILSSFILTSNASYASKTSGAEASLKLAQMALTLGDFAEAKKFAVEGLNANPDKKTKKALKKVEAAAFKKTSNRHKITGALTIGYATNSDIGAASQPKGGRVTDNVADDEEEGEDENADIEEDDAIDDLVNDDSFDDRELEEFSDDGDADQDGIDDLIDDDVDDNLFGGDSFFSKGKDSESTLFQTAKLGYSYLMSEKGHIWNSSASFGNLNNDDRTELDRRSYGFSTGPVFNLPCMKLKINPSVTYATLIKDHNELASAWAYALGFTHKTTEKLTLGAKFSLAKNDIEAMKSPDSDAYGAKFAASYKLTKEDIFNFSLSPTHNASSKRLSKQDGVGYSLGYVRVLPWDMAAGLTFSYKDASVINLDPERNDYTYKYAFEIGKKFGKSFSLTAQAIDQQKKSSFAAKDTRNQGFILSAGYSF